LLARRCRRPEAVEQAAKHVIRLDGNAGSYGQAGVGDVVRVIPIVKWF